MLIWGCVGCGEAASEEAPAVEAPVENPVVPGTTESTVNIDPNAGISPYYYPGNIENADAHVNYAPNSDDLYAVGDTNENADIPEVDDGRVDTDVYVAPYGNDANPGTETQPFLTIQKGIDSVKPGHTVYIKSGIYLGNFVFHSSGNDEEGNITVAAAPLQDVIVSLPEGVPGAIFDLNGQSNITIRELKIGYTVRDWVYGILLRGGEHNVQITDNDICNIGTYRSHTGGGGYGVLLYGEGYNEEAAISNVSIDNNRVYNMETGDGIAIAAGGNIDNLIIASNIVYGISNIGIDLYGNADYCSNPALDQPRHCLITENTVYNCVSDAYAVAGIYIDGACDTEVSRNIVYENMFGIAVVCEHRDDNYPVSNINVHHNTIHDNHDGGITIGGYDITLSGMVQDSIITANTMYNNGDLANQGWNGEINIEKCSNIVISDNEIIAHNYKYPVISCQKSIDFVRNVSFVNNLYLTGQPNDIKFWFAGEVYTGLEAWNKAVNGKDISSRSSN